MGKTLCGVCTTMYLLLGSMYGISGHAALSLKYLRQQSQTRACLKR